MSALESSQAAAPETDWTLGGAASAPRDPPPANRFARHHRGDRNFFLVYVGLIWLGILSGFGPQVSSTSKLTPPRIRLHRAYVAGVAWIGAVQLTALTVYTSPGWAPIALRLLGH
jgi:hypothetical protein